MGGVFELFVFSDIFELNRNILSSGSSLLISLIKDKSNEDNRFKRINVKKLVLIKDLINKPIQKIRFQTKKKENIKILSDFAKEMGNTDVEIEFNDNNKKLIFKLKNKRNIQRNMLKSLKKRDISTIIN